MNYEADDLLDMVDEWRFKLHEKLKKMTPKQRQEFWRQGGEKAKAMGLMVVTKIPKKLPKRRPAAKKRSSKAS